MEARGSGAAEGSPESAGRSSRPALGVQPQVWVAPQRAAALAALLPLAVAMSAAFFQPFRPVALVLAIGGTLIAGRRRSAGVWPWAATVPVMAIYVWGKLPTPDALPALASCASLLSPPMLWRIGELAMVLVVIAVLVRWLGPAPPYVPRARLPGWLLATAGTVGLAIAPLALVMGADASRPFFGDRDFEIGVVGAIVPALVFAFANATLEETVYRGALLGWLEPALGTTGAILAQAAVFGLAHNGIDYVASPLPIIIAMFATGAIAGFVVKRTGSLLVPIVLHAAFDVPLYYSLACRVT